MPSFHISSELGLDGVVPSPCLREFRHCPHLFLRVASQPRSDWAQRVKEVEEAATRSDERARLAEDSSASLRNSPGQKMVKGY